MAVSILIGAQWGDEGKGKIIDVISATSDFVVRFHGGNNAGHTVINKYGKFPLHLIPSGIFAKKAVAMITNGTVMDLDVLWDEIQMLEKTGFKLKGRLFISPRCHIIFPYHKIFDKLYENAKGKKKTGTTGRGIGPVYADKVSYQGIRLIDLMNKKQFSEKLAVQLLIKNTILKAFGEKPLNQKEIEVKYFALRDKLMPYIKEPYPILQKAVAKGKNIMLEGAQGVFLDNDWGTYPFSTASTVLAGGANAGAGLAPNMITQVLGVVKAYTTRVGEGPFPTELFDVFGEKLRGDGAEFGATTGRPRRCGWFDAELIRFAAQINGFTDIAITKLDVLDEFKEIQICTGYTYKGKKVQYFDGDAEFLAQVKPVYKTMKGWNQSTRGVTDYNKLPKKAQLYIKELEKQIGVPVTYISTGPKREEVILITKH
jgi:adenylosuccinate synthase